MTIQIDHDHENLYAENVNELLIRPRICIIICMLSKYLLMYVEVQI